MDMLESYEEVWTEDVKLEAALAKFQSEVVKRPRDYNMIGDEPTSPNRSNDFNS